MQKLTPDQFPALLREIPDPPKLLYLEGKLPEGDDLKWLTVVGSRRHSTYGKEACQMLIEGLAGFPIVIVSGLAVGIDAIAHRAALTAGLKVVAVPGSGLGRDIIFPQANKKLADEIIEAGGALLSEFEPDFKATFYSFPQRNRIMAGLSQATLIVEAGEKSGTLITARLTSDYNRELLVVPGSIFSPNHRGVHQFLKLGATPVTISEDILRALGFDIEEQEKVLPEDLSADEKKALELLAVEPLPRDELIRQLGLRTSDANTLLAVMELKGLIKETLGEVRIA